MFGTRQQLAKIKLDEIELLDNWVKVCHKVKHLSIIFESDMSMNSQISHMCQSVSFQLRNVKTVSRFLTKESVKTTVVSNASSRLNTRNYLLAGICNCRKLSNSVTCGCNIKRLWRPVQTNAARVVQQAWRQHHITPVLHQLHWLPVTHRVLYNILIIVFKCLHGIAPVYLTELLHLYQPSRSLHSQNKGLTLIIPRTNSVKAGNQKLMFQKWVQLCGWHSQKHLCLPIYSMI